LLYYYIIILIVFHLITISPTYSICNYRWRVYDSLS